jgi:ABC-type uncharacterized transport system auxiliary subunit
MRAARLVSAVIAILAVGGLAACSLTRPGVERVTFDLSPARGTPAVGVQKPVALKLRAFRTAAPYDGREFLYRTADGELVADFYHGFAAGPGELVTAATADWLRASGLFRAVLEPGVSVDAPYALEGSVLALYGDVGDPQHPAAVMQLQVYVIHAAPAARELVLDRRFAERVPIADATPQALAKGFDEALGRILTRVERELAAFDFKR